MGSFDFGASEVSFIASEKSHQKEILRLLPQDGIPVESWKYKYLKRGMDLSIGLVILILLAVPCLLIAAMVALSSRGPVFYRETRIGRYGRPFRIWKFRSMRHAANLENAPGDASVSDDQSFRTRKGNHDPRITTIGRFLRRWSLDELPQIINVVRGEMSLIGPRPIVEAETYLYESLLPYYLAATPGMSGLWQVSGRSNIDYPKRAGLDASYVTGWSLSADLEILLLTLPAVLARRGAH